jgi:hypothetical protein
MIVVSEVRTMEDNMPKLVNAVTGKVLSELSDSWKSELILEPEDTPAGRRAMYRYYREALIVPAIVAWYYANHTQRIRYTPTTVRYVCNNTLTWGK